MDSYNVDDVEVEKANAISMFRRVQRVTTLFRFVEVMVVFLVILSRFYTQFASSLKVTGEYIRGICTILISTRFVFILGNVIVIALYVISGKYPAKNDETSSDVYGEYMEKCQDNPPPFPVEKKEAADAYTCTDPCEEKKVIISRSQSEKLERPASVMAVARRRNFRRSKSENSCRSVVSARKEAAGVGASAFAAVSSYAEDDMTSEEFRRTVEAFIARQQKVLREEELAAEVSI